MTVDYLSAVIFCFADMLDKNLSASTVCTILDWHTVNVAGMWMLHPVYSIHLAQGIIDSTGAEAQNACKCKESIKYCLPHVL